MRTLLVATDFSDHAKIAGEFAIRLARLQDANLVCVHATIMTEAEPNAYELAQGQLEGFRQDLQKRLGAKRRLLELLSDEAGRRGVRSQHFLVDGSPAKSICAAAKEIGADLVILGSHGHTGFKRILLGSVAEKAIRLCKSSVLVARRPLVHEAGFQRILVATDYSDSSRAALDHACAMANVDATIDILHCWNVAGLADYTVDPAATPVYTVDMEQSVVADATRRGRKMVARARGAERTVRFHLHRGSPAAGIQVFIEDQEPGYDLVAVGTHGRTGVSRLLLGSVAEAAVRYSPCSVLVARV